MYKRSPNSGINKALVSLVLLSAAAAANAQSVHVSTFASGSGVNASGPDSVTASKNSLWVSYTNGADSTGLGGSSTVVQYHLKNGHVVSVHSLAGSVDGLKIDPKTGDVWALQNQDGNSTLTLIDGEDKAVSKSVSYAITSSTRGIDDVAFRLDETYLSYTNPVSPGDPTILLLQEDTKPLVTTPVLRFGALGFDLASGLANQPTSQADPDSLQVTPYGDLMLSSGSNAQLIFVMRPGTSTQSVSFLNLLDSTKKPAADLDDASFATSRKGAFYLADTGNNRILKIEASDFPVGSLYASVASLKALGRVDLKTGVVTPVVSDLNGPHGLLFVAQVEKDEDCSKED